jgi:hypothetical protein
MSNWNSDPSSALWYGEVLFTKDGAKDYNYAYSADTERPDPYDIPVPEGWVIQHTLVAEVIPEEYLRCGRS